jgi:hypothetical protein
MKFSLRPSDRKYKDVDSEIIPIKKFEETLIEEKFNPWDYIRVVNVRGDPEYQATKNEKIIIAHRGNSILGNKHPMKAQTMSERDRVIAEHKKDLDADLDIKGPIFRVLQNIAEDIIENKQKIALQCFCTPFLSFNTFKC